MIKLKKILFFIPTLKGRGAEKVLVNLVNNLDEKKYQITVQTLFDSGIHKKELKENIEYRYIFKKIFRGNVYILKLFKPETLYKMMIKEKYDIIVSYLQSPTTRIISGCNEKDVKLINWIHNEITNKSIFTKVYRNERELESCLKKYDLTVFVSRTAKESFEKNFDFKLNSCVKYNIVEDEYIREKGKEEVDDIKFERGKINLISVGGLVEQKGYMRLIKVVEKIIAEKANLHLYILGDGNQRNMIEQYIRKNNLENYITLLGYKENPYKYVKRADLFVCSSYHEGYSTAVTEALILGVPVITTLCSGMEELLESGKYGIITKNTEKDLYEKLKSLLNDDAKLKKYKEMAEKRSQYFDKKNNIKEIEKIL